MRRCSSSPIAKRRWTPGRGSAKRPTTRLTQARLTAARPRRSNCWYVRLFSVYMSGDPEGKFGLHEDDFGGAHLAVLAKRRKLLWKKEERVRAGGTP